MFARLGGHRHVLLLTGAAAAWGLATVISKRAVDEIAPLTLLPVQLTVSVVTLMILIRVQGLRPVWSPEARRLGALGLLNPGVAYTLSLLGLAHITASLSVLLWTVEPILILVLARWLLRDRITRPLAIVMAAAFAGVLLIVVQSGAGGAPVGVALTLAGVGACAAYAVVCRKLLLAADSTVTVVLIQQSYALAYAVALFAGAHLLGVPAGVMNVSAWAWLSAVASGVFYYAIAFYLYLSGLRRVSATVAGIFINLIPAFGIAAGHLLLAERLTVRQWIGAGVVVAAVGAATMVRKDDHLTG
jgi:drug/metabolite transporter (DMT)-like permease